MSTAKFAGRGAVMTRIAPHATGHYMGHGRHPAARRLRMRRRPGRDALRPESVRHSAGQGVRRPVQPAGVASGVSCCAKIPRDLPVSGIFDLHPTFEKIRAARCLASAASRDFFDRRQLLPAVGKQSADLVAGDAGYAE